MKELTGLIALLGEKNVEVLKTEIVKLILEQFERDLKERYTYDYMFEPQEINTFINECKQEAFNKVHDEIVALFESKIKKSI